jgi:hypothetical protein
MGVKSMLSTFKFPAIFALVFLAVGLGLLWILNHLLGWNLKVVTDHAGFFQAWIYILQTFALVATLVYLGLETSAVQKSVAINTVQLMVTSHRELLGNMLDRPQLWDALTGDDVPGDAASRVYMSMVFNHGFNAFSLHDARYIDEEWWKATVEDMKSILGRQAMRKWWTSIKKYYPVRYQTFIEHDVFGDVGGT